MTIYNNPAMAQAAQNLASIFAPPSGSDLAGYANAGLTNTRRSQLEWLFANPNDPTASHRSALTGVQGFSQTPTGFGMTDATNRRGQDISASTALDVARLSNEAANWRHVNTPITANENQTVYLPEELQDATGLADIIFGNVNVAPGETSHLSDGRVVAGAEKPMTESEMIASIIADMPPELQQARAFGSTPLEQVAGADGPEFATRPQAIGQTPAPTGQEGARKDAVAVINGQTVPVTRAPNEMVWRTADGQPIPPDAQVFSLPSPTGSAEDVGMTTAVTSGVQNRIIATQQTIDTAGQLLATIRNNPSSQGIAGMIRGTAQDVIQAGGELGQLLGGGVAEVTEAVRNGIAEAGVGAEFFDPSIPAIDMLTNLLAWQYAKSMAGDRVSNEQLRAAREAIGGAGMFANQANSEARLTELIRMLETQQAQLQSLQPGFGVTAPSVPPPTGSSSALPSYTDYDSLPSGARFLDPEGNIREKL